MNYSPWTWLPCLYTDELVEAFGENIEQTDDERERFNQVSDDQPTDHDLSATSDEDVFLPAVPASPVSSCSIYVMHLMQCFKMISVRIQ